jgi:hypothetical protein
MKLLILTLLYTKECPLHNLKTCADKRDPFEEDRSTVKMLWGFGKGFTQQTHT